MTALVYFVFLLALVFDMETDAALIARGKPVNHLRGALLFAPVLALAWWLTGSVVWMPHLLAMRWLMFDYLLNIRRGLDGLRYIGLSADKEPDALTDRILEKIGWRWALAVKLFFCVLSIAMLITIRP